MDREAEVSYDGRVGRWKVDMYRYDRGAGDWLHDREVGQYDTKDEARGAAEEAARRENAGVYLETRNGDLDRRYPPTPR